MEPRRIRRGNTMTADDGASLSQALQWSRGEFAAETHRVAAGAARSTPLQWSRGEFAAETSIGILRPRSSVPLQWSRGEFAAETEKHMKFTLELTAASMEPRRIRRGNVHVSARNGRGAGFNGAAANSPRKRGGVPRPPGRQRASMEPRRIRRGNPTTKPARSPKATGLQWSRGEFAAETSRRQCPPLWRARLQWSRGEFAAETPMRGSGMPAGYVASMEPRRIRRGNSERCSTTVPSRTQASMEPRRIRRGNFRRLRLSVPPQHGLQWSRGEFAAETGLSLPPAAATWKLQWSRGEFAAETTSAPGAGTAPYTLQWSRGEFAAETQAPCPGAARDRRFNGAAANSPRKRRWLVGGAE